MDMQQYRAGTYKKQYGYQSFSPQPVNHHWVISNAKLILLLSEADRKIGELNAYSFLVPDVDFFVKMHIAKEATKSSRIAGVQITIGEALQHAGQIDPEKLNNWQEVHHYIEATNEGIKLLDKMVLGNRLLQLTHKKLMERASRVYKSPGWFRTSQNWIGGASLKDAYFIPPTPDEVPQLMEDLEMFLHNVDISIPHLICIAIAHYQIETIHPFLDGNGRLGRLFITLYLISNNVLSKPVLYLSDFFEQNRQLYHDNLSLVRTKNEILQWLTFFLVGVKETAQHSIDTFNAIITLRQEVENRRIIQLGKKVPLAMELIKNLYSKPIVDVNEIATALSVNISTAHRLVQDFEKLGILKEQTGYKRNRIFVFEDYLNLFK